MNEDNTDIDAVSEIFPWVLGPGYNEAQLLELRRQEPFHAKMRITLNELGYTEAIRKRDTDRVMEISKVYVDQWLEFDPAYPGLHGYFQAAYWINRLTGGLVRDKRYEEALYYLEIYFSREWDVRFFASEKSTNVKMRKRRERVIALL